MSLHVDYKYILSQSFLLGHQSCPDWIISLSLLHCQNIVTWNAGHCPWGHIYKQDSYLS